MCHNMELIARSEKEINSLQNDLDSAISKIKENEGFLAELQSSILNRIKYGRKYNEYITTFKKDIAYYSESKEIIEKALAKQMDWLQSLKADHDEELAKTHVPKEYLTYEYLKIFDGYLEEHGTMTFKQCLALYEAEHLKQYSEDLVRRIREI